MRNQKITKAAAIVTNQEPTKYVIFSLLFYLSYLLQVVPWVTFYIVMPSQR